MDPSTFAKLAGDDGQLDPAEVEKCLEADVPESRKSLNPRVAAHVDMLTHILRYDRRAAPGSR